MTDGTDLPSRPRRITAQMVADLAGVSRSAVSRAFTGGGYVEAEKRSKIFEIAAELGYQPNALAAGLQGGRSRLVAVIAGDMPNSHDSDLVNQLCHALNVENLWPLMVSGQLSGSDIRIEDALRFPLDAIVVRGGSMSLDLVQRCGKLGIPMICYGRLLDNGEADAVCCRNDVGMRQMTEMLVRAGRRRVGFIAGPDGFYASAERRRGVTEALAAEGLALEAEETGDFTVDGGFRAASRVFEARADLDALICANDATAIGALGAAQKRGLSVPADVAVTGFDDMDLAKWPIYDLTTVRNPIDQTVSAILRLIQSRIDAPNRPNETVHIEPALVLRQTH